LHHLTREGISDVGALLHQLATENDRTVALAGGAVLEQDLVRIIRESFIPLNDEEMADTFFEPDALLGTFARRTTMAHLLGLIDAGVKADLDRIRRIRNVFAHRVEDLKFSHPQIAEVCEKLHFFRKDMPPPDRKKPRDRFVFCVIALNLKLSNEHALQLERYLKRYVLYLKTLHTPEADAEAKRLTVFLNAKVYDPEQEQFVANPSVYRAGPLS